MPWRSVASDESGSGYQPAWHDSRALGRDRRGLLSPPWPGLLQHAAARAKGEKRASSWIWHPRNGYKWLFKKGGGSERGMEQVGWWAPTKASFSLHRRVFSLSKQLWISFLFGQQIFISVKVFKNHKEKIKIKLSSWRAISSLGRDAPFFLEMLCNSRTNLDSQHRLLLCPLYPHKHPLSSFLHSQD